MSMQGKTVNIHPNEGRYSVGGGKPNRAWA